MGQKCPRRESGGGDTEAQKGAVGGSKSLLSTEEVHENRSGFW